MLVPLLKPMICFFAVPRMLFEGLTMSDFHTIFHSRDALDELVDFIVGFTKVKSTRSAAFFPFVPKFKKLSTYLNF